MERGWRECSYNSANQRDNWNLWWKTSAFPVSQHKQLKAWQVRKTSSQYENIQKKISCSLQTTYQKERQSAAKTI